jgi:hypothetical protein
VFTGIFCFYDLWNFFINGHCTPFSINNSSSSSQTRRTSSEGGGGGGRPPISFRPIHGLSGLSDPTKLERYLHDFFSVEVWAMRNLFVYFLYRNIHCWNSVPLHIFCDNISIHHEILIGKIGVTNVTLISFCWQQIGTKMPHIHVCMDSYLWTNYMVFFLQKLAFWTFSCFVSTFVSNCCAEHPSMPIMQLHRQPLFALPDSQAGKCSLSYLYPFSIFCTSSHGTTATRFNSFND